MKTPEILYEDADVVVVNKPAGISVHQDGRRKAKAPEGSSPGASQGEAFREETLADWFASYVPEAEGVGEPLTLTNGVVVDRPGIVHRLDKETSGVMILAKHQDAFLFLKHQFQERKTTKIYRAFVWGEMKEASGVIELPIGRSRSDFRRRSAERGAKPPLRDALTEWALILGASEFSYVEVRPKTGRMHQIRVHFKALQHPLVADALYAPKRPSALGFERLALHARSLSLALPNGDTRTFEAPLPEDFRRAEKALAARD